MTNPITNVAGIVDPLSIGELRLAVSSSQTTKAAVLTYNILENLVSHTSYLEAEVNRLTAKLASLEAEEPAPKKAPAARKAAASKEDPAEA